MAITSRNNGYKISELEEIDGLKSGIDDTDGSALNSENLFVVSNTDDGGSSYSSRKLKYSALAMSLATTIDQMLGGDGQGSRIGGNCCFEGLGVPGNEYPIANAFFPNQRTAVSSIEFTCPTNTLGIYFNDRNQITVPDLDSRRMVNVNVFLSAWASTNTTGNVSPGLGIYVQQTDMAGDNPNIYIPIKDDQFDTGGWSVCIADFIAKPGTIFGGYVYNPDKNKIGHISAFFRLPMPAIYEGEEEGRSDKIYFDQDLTASVINKTLSSSSGFYEVRSSLALSKEGAGALKASLDHGNTWYNVMRTTFPTNAGSGSANTKIRKHNSIYIPEGCWLQFITQYGVKKTAYVTNKDPATIYLTKKEDEFINIDKNNGIVAQFNTTADAPGTETFHFQLAKSGKLNIKWEMGPTVGQNVQQLGEQYNYTSTTKHDGQYKTSTPTPHVLHVYTKPGSHLAYIAGASPDQRILAFDMSYKRNRITHLSTYSPTVLSANCLSGLSSLQGVYSDSRNIAYLRKACMKDCTELTSVQLTCASKLTIDSQCFAGDTHLQKIKIVGGSVINGFGNSFAKNCSSLTSVVLPNFDSQVGDYTASEAPFYGCTSLTSLNLDASSTGYIGGAIARQCTSLKEFTWKGGCKALSANMMFDQNTMSSLTSFTVEFAASPYTFSGAAITTSNSLKNLSFKNVKIATTQAFKNNTALSSIVFDGQCSPIPSKTFSGCAALQEVVFKENTISHITKTLFGSKCFQIGGEVILMYFPDEVTEETIEALLKYNSKANSILYIDNTNKNTTITREIQVFRLRARGHVENNEENRKHMCLGTYKFKHTKDPKGNSTYTENWDHNDLYNKDYVPSV